MVLMPPYGLSFLGERAYGITNGLFGAGMIAGGLLYGMLAKRFTNTQQFLVDRARARRSCTSAYGFSRDAFSLGAMNLLIAMIMTIGNAAIMTVWQLKVPDETAGSRAVDDAPRRGHDDSGVVPDRGAADRRSRGAAAVSDAAARPIRWARCSA